MAHTRRPRRSLCWEGRRRGGPGALIDLSRCEVANTGAGNFMDVFHAVQSGFDTPPVGPPRVLETPSIERTADGWVGFNTNAPHQLEAFLRMIGRPDLADSGEFTMASSRIARVAEWNALVTGWTSEHTTDEIVALAVAHKVPVAPVCNGRTVAELDHVRRPPQPHRRSERSVPDAGPTVANPRERGRRQAAAAAGARAAERGRAATAMADERRAPSVGTRRTHLR